jgi:hypothetical protein
VNVLSEQQRHRAVKVMNEYLSAPRTPDGKTPAEIETELDQNRLRSSTTTSTPFFTEKSVSSALKVAVLAA